MSFNILNIFGFLTVNISGNVQVVIVLRVAYFFNAYQTAVFWYIGLFGKNIYNFMNILLTQTVFVAVFYEAFAGINHENVFAFLGSFLV
ncbi:hypothetical protein SDC9_104033 [bioreactor metagenome]|uniref:Uncharacterized protein n=1 Tax=bioreactor metagenome TaxID=1076179 RepID=A0A645AY25_9ZZZZ